jgi:hypothetical protein
MSQQTTLQSVGFGLSAHIDEGEQPSIATMREWLTAIESHLAAQQAMANKDLMLFGNAFAFDGIRIDPVRVRISEPSTTCTEGLQVENEPFQTRVGAWMDECFVPSLYSNMVERGDRLLEEVLELLQAHGYDRSRVGTLVDYVYGRPVGEPGQEVGGVMITLAGFCYIAGLDMHAEGQRELERISQPDVMAKIRAKQEAKNALHFDTPLPGASRE